MVLGGGLEPPRLAAYAPQTYVSAISPPELVQGREMINTTCRSRKTDYSERLRLRSTASPVAVRRLLGGCWTQRWGRDRVRAIRRSRSPQPSLIKDENAPLASGTPSRRA